MVAGSVRNFFAAALTGRSTNSRGRSKAGRIVAWRLGVNELSRAEGLIEAALLRRLRMGKKHPANDNLLSIYGFAVPPAHSSTGYKMAELVPAQDFLPTPAYNVPQSSVKNGAR